MSKAHLVVSLATAKDITDWKFGQELFSRIHRTDGLLQPETVTVALVGKQPVQSIYDLRPFWAKSVTLVEAPERVTAMAELHWECKAAEAYGSVEFPFINLKSQLSLGGLLLNTRYSSKADWEGFFRWICEAWEPEAALMHVVGPMELTPHPQIVGPYSQYCKPIGGGLRNNQLPNLGWATYFGKQWAKEIDRASLESAGARVEKIHDGFLLSLTDDLVDVVRNFPSFAKARHAAKGAFRSDMFEIQTEHPSAGLDGA